MAAVAPRPTGGSGQPIRQNEAERIVSAWFHFVKKIGDEKSALKELVPDNQKTVIEAIRIMRDELFENKTYLSSPLGAPLGDRASKLIEVLDRNGKFTPQELTKKRVEKSFRAIVEPKPTLGNRLRETIGKIKGALPSPQEPITAAETGSTSLKIEADELKIIEDCRFLVFKGKALANDLNLAENPQAVDNIIFDYFTNPRYESVEGDPNLSYQNFKRLLLDVHERIETIKEGVEEDPQKTEEVMIDQLADQLAEPFFGKAKYPEERAAQVEAVKQILYYRLAIGR
jgi:hypothetical protein